MVVFVTYENFPDGSPGAIRCKSFVDAYLKLGYDVTVIHKGILQNEYYPHFLSCYKPNKLKKLLLFERTVKKHLEQLKRSSTIDAVIIYGFFSEIIRWCRKNNIIYVTDVVEWYSKEQFKWGKFSLSYILNQRNIRRITNSNANIIAISSYLEEHFKRHGHKTVRIPIMTSVSNNLVSKRMSMDKIKIIYAGSHLLMDNVIMVIKAISCLEEKLRERILFTIYGISQEQICKYLTDKEKRILDSNVKIKGRKPNKVILEDYKLTHFCIVLRDPELRVNKAGFPSKVVESMKMGVPVICNYSSDLNLYLKDGVNSILVKELSLKSLIETINRILEIDEDKYEFLSRNCLQTVEKKFNISTYSNECTTIIH